MGTMLAHMLREDAASPDTAGPAAAPGPPNSLPDRSGDHPDRSSVSESPASPGPPGPTIGPSRPGVRASPRTTRPDLHRAEPKTGEARLVARSLAISGKPLSRRALRSGGVKGSNEALNRLAREINAELRKTPA
jgi:hypothetical protein